MPPRSDTENVLVSELSALVEPAETELTRTTAASSQPPPPPRPREVSTPIAPVLGVSVLAHVLLALALGALDAVPVLAALEPTFVEVDVSSPPVPAAPAVEPEPLPPPPEPVATPAPSLRARPTPTPTPEPVAPTPEPPPPEPSAAPPSVDDVFGEEPAPAAEVLAAQGATGGPAMDLGAAGGRAGGRAGGTGEGVGPGGGTGAGSGGPSDADRRRARRAYVRSLEGLLGGRVRYPRAAARERLEGRAELCLRIGDDGRVLGSRVCSSSGHDLLDDAALTAAQALERVPAPPALAAWAPSDEVHAGIQFRVQ